MDKVGMSFRIEKSLKNKFVNKCKREEIPASVVIREFMKGFVKQSQYPKYPNEETIQAMNDLKKGIDIAKFDSINALKDDLLSG